MRSKLSVLRRRKLVENIVVAANFLCRSRINKTDVFYGDDGEKIEANSEVDKWFHSKLVHSLSRLSHLALNGSCKCHVSIVCFDWSSTKLLRLNGWSTSTK